MASSEASTSKVAQANFELANDVKTVSSDEVYRYDKASQDAIRVARPWRQDPHYFKKVKISAVALIKMVMHARSGGQYEIMGIMQGKVDGDTMIVMDAFALPVLGTETRVNAAHEAQEFMIQYIEGSPKTGRLENAIGWYHSHPGYGCWLSGIDVQTQLTNQTYDDPFLAVVIDPNRTISAGRVDIGAFRTYPEGYTPPNAAASEYQSIPLNKIEDFGVHANAYYSLPIEHFKSSNDEKLLEMLWEKYWVMTLSQSPLVSNRSFATNQLSDLMDKLAGTTSSVSHKANVGALSTVIAQARAAKRAADASAPAPAMAMTGSDAKSGGSSSGSNAKEEEQTPLSKAVRDVKNVSDEASMGLVSAMLKDSLFNEGRLSQPGGFDPKRGWQMPPLAP